ncbi:MAG: hypothetical protein ABIP64_11475 [Burkholderiales bacterium]
MIPWLERGKEFPPLLTALKDLAIGFLDKDPLGCHWLTPQEKSFVVQRLEEDNKRKAMVAATTIFLSR